MAKKRAEEKGACSSLSEIVYFLTLSQPRHLATLLLLSRTARDDEKGKFFLVSHNECDREASKARAKVNLSDTWSQRDVTSLQRLHSKSSSFFT
jgi:hypothetical protein